MNNDHETNFGWWTDRPDRPERPSKFAPMGRPAPRKADFVWRHLVLIVVLALTLILSVVMLAARHETLSRRAWAATTRAPPATARGWPAQHLILFLTFGEWSRRP